MDRERAVEYMDSSTSGFYRHLQPKCTKAMHGIHPKITSFPDFRQNDIIQLKNEKKVECF